MRQRKWSELVKDYDCDTWYYPGKANVAAKALSRKVMLSQVISCQELQKEIEKD